MKAIVEYRGEGRPLTSGVMKATTILSAKKEEICAQPKPEDYTFVNRGTDETNISRTRPILQKIAIGAGMIDNKSQNSIAPCLCKKNIHNNDKVWHVVVSVPTIMYSIIDFACMLCGGTPSLLDLFGMKKMTEILEHFIKHGKFLNFHNGIRKLV